MGPVLQMRRLRLRERKGLVQVYSTVQPGLGPSLGDPKAMFYCSNLGDTQDRLRGPGGPLLTT